MNRRLATAITKTSSLSWCDAARLAQGALGQGSMQAGLPAPVAYAHDSGRENDDASPSGEGHG